MPKKSSRAKKAPTQQQPLIQEPQVSQSTTTPKPNFWPLIALGLCAIFVIPALFTPDYSKQEQTAKPSLTKTVLVPTTTTAPTPTIDPDPLVDCKYSSECGGTRKVKSSICRNSTCCRIADKAVIMGVEQCNEAVKKYNEDTRKIIDEYNKKMDEAEQKYNEARPTIKPYLIPTNAPYVPATTAPQPTSGLTEQQKQIKRDLLQAEIDQCKANAISKKSSSLQVCYVSPEGSWQENCVASAQSTFETALRICVYNYEFGIAELAK